MKKLILFFFAFGISICSLGQVANKLNMVLNNDTSPFDIFVHYPSFEFTYKFKQEDVVSFSLSELKASASTQTIEVISKATNEVISIATFDQNHVEQGYQLDLAIDQLRQKVSSESTKDVYTLIIKDGEEEQVLIQFVLV